MNNNLRASGRYGDSCAKHAVPAGPTCQQLAGHSNAVQLILQPAGQPPHGHTPHRSAQTHTMIYSTSIAVQDARCRTSCVGSEVGPLDPLSRRRALGVQCYDGQSLCCSTAQAQTLNPRPWSNSQSSPECGRVVLQVLAHALRLGHHLDAGLSKLLLWTNA